MAQNGNDMPNEVKRTIVDNIVAKTNLEMCSKSDRPMHIENLSAFHDPSFKWLAIDTLDLQEVDGELVKRIPGYPIKQTKQQEERGRNLYKKFVGNLLSHGIIRIDNFFTNLDFPSELTNTTINAKKASICGEDEEVMKWINALSPKTAEITIGVRDREVLKGTGAIPVIINAQKLMIMRKNDITDEQLMAFKFTKGWIMRSKTTINGVVEFIQKIASSDYPLDTNIHIFTIKEIRSYYLDINMQEIRFCLPMNSEKEVVYFYHPFLYCFSIFVQKAGGPVRTYDQHREIEKK